MPPGRRNADQIVANVRAMDAAVTLSEQLGGEAILAMHRALTEHIDPAIAGRSGARNRSGSVAAHSARTTPPSCRPTTTGCSRRSPTWLPSCTATICRS